MTRRSFFVLLSDHDHHVGRLYQSCNEQLGHNRRIVFYITMQGVIAYSDTRYSVASGDSFSALKRAVEDMR